MKGENIVVAGGDMVGCECSLYLVNQGKTVTILEMLEDILSLRGICHRRCQAGEADS